MKKILILVDMQKDFVDGALGTQAAQAIVPAVGAKLAAARAAGETVIFTRDSHLDNYLETLEGKELPVPHCIKGTPGWEIIPALSPLPGERVIDKPSFGSLELADTLHDLMERDSAIELCGLCTDICVVSNALLLRANFPNNPILVDGAACAGTSPEGHQAALTTMAMCQIHVINQ